MEIEKNDLLNSTLHIDEVGATHLLETAKWGKFLAIMGFIACGLLAIGALFYLFQFGAHLSSFGTVNFFTYLISAVIYFFPAIYLYRFSTKTKSAILTNNQLQINEALDNQRRALKYLGIMTIILFAFALLAIAFGGVMALTGGFGR